MEICLETACSWQDCKDLVHTDMREDETKWKWPELKHEASVGLPKTAAPQTVIWDWPQKNHSTRDPTLKCQTLQQRGTEKIRLVSKANFPVCGNCGVNFHITHLFKLYSRLKLVLVPFREFFTKLLVKQHGDWAVNCRNDHTCTRSLCPNFFPPFSG